MSSPFPSSLATARTGRIAWVFDTKGVRNIWLADPPVFAARQLTNYANDDGNEISSVRLTPDGRKVLYVRGSEINSAGEVADPTSNDQIRKQEVWAADTERSDPPRLLGEMGCDREGCEDLEVSPDGRWAVWAARRQLWIAPVNGGLPAKPLMGYIRGDNARPRWSPDSRRIAFVSDRGDHSFIGIIEVGRNHLLWMAPSVDRDLMPRWSFDGGQVVWIRVRGRMTKPALLPVEVHPWAIWTGDPQSGLAKQVWHSGSTLESSFPSWGAERAFNFGKDRIIFAYEKNGWNHLYSIPPTGGIERLLTPGEFDVEHVALSTDGSALIYSSNQTGADPRDADRRHIWTVPANGGTPRALSSGEGSEYEPIETGDGRFVVCFGSGARTSKMPYVLIAGNRKLIAGEALPADFPSDKLVEPTQVIFRSEDGWTIHGQLFLPTVNHGPAPGLLFLHGGLRNRQMLLGFHYMQYYHNAYAENQYLASLGYVVLSVNYRNGTMYGRKFREVPDSGPGGASDYQDVLAAAEYLRALPQVDKTRVGLWGGSYGGYLTALGLARNSDVFSAGVDMHGVHDWSQWGEIGRMDNAIDIREARERAFASSPDAAITSWKSPALLIAGDDDRNVSFSQTVDLAQRLRAQKVPFEQLVFPDEIHEFLLWRNWISAYEATSDFFERVLKHGEKIPLSR